MQGFNLRKFANPRPHWLLQLLPGPVGTVANLVETIRNDQEMSELTSKVAQLNEQQDLFGTQVLKLMEQANSRLASASSVSDVKLSIDEMNQLARHQTFPLLSTEIVRDDVLRDELISDPSRFGKIVAGDDEARLNGLNLIGVGDKPFMLSPTPQTLFDLVQFRPRVNSVSPLMYRHVITTRKRNAKDW